MTEKKGQSTDQRFPRLAEAKHIGQLAKRIWKKPRFDYQDDGKTTEFIFRLGFSIRKKIRRTEPAIWELLKEGGPRWRESFIQAHRDAHRPDEKRVSNLIADLLYKVFLDALEIRFRNAEVSPNVFHPKLRGQPEEILKHSRRKRRPQQGKLRRYAKRYATLRPQVEELRRFVKENSPASGTDLNAKVEGHFPSYKWLKYVTQGNALQNLFSIPGHEDEKPESLSDVRHWTPRQLAVAIMVCEELDLHHRTITPKTMYENIQTGNKLLKASRSA